jgi:putative PIN family toxin of toxin-antitoxin system
MMAENEPVRAVLDANVIASALIRPQGPPGQILVRIGQDQVMPVFADSIVDELRRVVAYPRVRRAIGLSDEEIELVIVSLVILGDLVEITGSQTYTNCPDPDDYMYIETALQGRATFLVTGDRHLLGLKTVEDVQILTPRQFLTRISERL